MDTKQVKIVVKQNDELVVYHPETIAKAVLVDDKTLEAVLAALTSNQELTAQKLNDLIDQVPAELDTLKEIADKIHESDNLHEALLTTISNKVDKVSGKQLSSEDFTVTLKNKLESLQNYIHPSTHSSNIITETADKQFVSVSEKIHWSSKTKFIVANDLNEIENGDFCLLVVE